MRRIKTEFRSSLSTEIVSSLIGYHFNKRCKCELSLFDESLLAKGKSCINDGIGQKILKFCSTAICGPLLYLFNQCLAQHTIPSEWRIHSSTPIHKSGDRANISNYRPISLLSCTSKLLERIIYNKSIDSLTNTVVSNHQFGFLKHRSSVQQLLLLINTIYNSLLTHSPTDVIYLDFRKAFDTVSHPKLLFKLWSSYGCGSEHTY